MAGKNSIFTNLTPPSVDSEWLNVIQNESKNVIESTGQTLSDVNTSQWAHSMVNYAGAGNFYTDTGSVNSYALGVQTDYKKPSRYKNGMLVRFRPANANTGSSTINVAELGVKDIKKADGTTDLSGGEIVATSDCYLRFDAENDAFVIALLIPEPMPTGTIITFASDDVPEGFLECNGAEISRTTYATLFGVIGTVYGEGDEEATFDLPDLRGEFVRGWDNARGIDSGRVFGSAQLDSLENITGNLGHIEYVVSTANGAFGLSGTASGIRSVSSGTQSLINFDASRVARTSTETRGRNIALMHCIKY